MKISASVYSNKTDSLENTIKLLHDNHADMLHVDCREDAAILEDIPRMRAISDKPIDLHLITSKPESYYELLEKYPCDFITLQHEDLNGPIIPPKGLAKKWGIAFTSETSIEAFEAYKEHFDFVLIMATTPGMSGGSFNAINFSKVRKFKEMYPGKGLRVDGGVNPEISFILRNMGVDAAVSGSFLFSGAEVGANMLDLKGESFKSKYLVRDFMRQQDEIPILSPTKRSLSDVLLALENYRLGFTVLVDNDGRMEGIISHADLRRAMISSLNNLNQLNASDMVNKNPFVLNENHTVSEMLILIKKQSFPISYAPVVNDHNEVTGALTFFHLIKGE